MRAPALVAGLAMAAYLALRPYPDDFTSPWWIVSHTSGMLAFVALAVLADRVGGRVRPLVALGVALVLPYYGAETFGLAAGANPDLARYHPVALAMFVAGLLLVAVGGVLLGIRQRAALPLGIMMALVLPQFFLPPAGRIAFGIVFALAALWYAWRAPRTSGSRTSQAAEPGRDGRRRGIVDAVEDRRLTDQ